MNNPFFVLDHVPVGGGISALIPPEIPVGLIRAAQHHQRKIDEDQALAKGEKGILKGQKMAALMVAGWAGPGADALPWPALTEAKALDIRVETIGMLPLGPFTQLVSTIADRFGLTDEEQGNSGGRFEQSPDTAKTPESSETSPAG